MELEDEELEESCTEWEVFEAIWQLSVLELLIQMRSIPISVQILFKIIKALAEHIKKLHMAC